MLVATGYADAWAEDDGSVHMMAEELRELARLAGLLPNIEALHEAAYVDRGGDMNLPPEAAEKLAHAYTPAEPEIVLMYIEDVESEYRARGYEPGKRYHYDLLREEMPGFALARYWAGHEVETAQLRGDRTAAQARGLGRRGTREGRSGARRLAPQARLGRTVGSRGPQLKVAVSAVE